MNTLHYILDPYCGWCYAAEPLVTAARALPRLEVVFHCGGMLAGANCLVITPRWRDYIVESNQRVTQMSGQPFGRGYLDLIEREGAVLDSEPPTTAILVAETLGGNGLDMIEHMQQALYMDGADLGDTGMLRVLGKKLGIDEGEFDREFSSLSGAATTAHIESSRRLLSQVGGRGFPTFALEQNGELMRVDTSAWLGRPDEWGVFLDGLIDRRTNTDRSEYEQ